MQLFLNTYDFPSIITDTNSFHQPWHLFIISWVCLLKNWTSRCKKFFSVWKTEMAIFKSNQNKFEGDSKIWLRFIMFTESSVNYVVVEIYLNLFCNIMLMVSPFNWIEPILSSSEEENVLVLLKCQDTFIEYAIFKSWLFCSFLVWAQNFRNI